MNSGPCLYFSRSACLQRAHPNAVTGSWSARPSAPPHFGADPKARALSSVGIQGQPRCSEGTFPPLSEFPVSLQDGTLPFGGFGSYLPFSHYLSSWGACAGAGLGMLSWSRQCSIPPVQQPPPGLRRARHYLMLFMCSWSRKGGGVGGGERRIKIDCKALHYPPPHTPTPGICGFFNWVFFLHISHMVASAVIHLYGNVLVIFSF